MPDDSPFEYGASVPRRAVDGLVAALGRLRSPLRAAAFWLAVALPFVYLPVVFSPFDWAIPAAIALLLVHAVSVLLGASHDPTR
jgi:hypothetical protein